MAARCDLLIKGGRVIDPAQGIDGPRDVTVLELVEGAFELRDAEDNPIPANQKLELRLTVCGGEALKLDRQYERSPDSWLPRR